MLCQAILKKGGPCRSKAKKDGFCGRHIKSASSAKPQVKRETYTYTLTFCEVAENHKGMQMIGEMAKEGYSLKQLKRFAKSFTTRTLYDLSLDENKAYLLVAKGGVDQLFKNEPELCSSEALLEEQKALEKDAKALMYGRVVNKKARQNLCFADFSQKADYEIGKGTVVDFKDVAVLSSLRDKLCHITGDPPLVAEGNYYIGDKTGIGFHGDSERRRVIGVRLGETMPLRFVWFQRGIPIDNPIDITLEHGDIYFMSEKAVGTDWKSSKIPTLRHAAGHSSFLSWTPSVKQKETINDRLEQGEELPEFATEWSYSEKKTAKQDSKEDE